MTPPSYQPGPDWEQKLERELKGLPDRQAPPSLIPKVMAAIQARARLPWWHRTWWTWPPAAQLLSLLLCSGLLGLLTYVAWLAEWPAWLAAPGHGVQSLLAPLAPLWSAVVALINAFGLPVREVGNLAVILAVVLCLAMYLSCVGLGTVFYRLAVRK